MEINKIAKNLLENKICDNCTHNNNKTCHYTIEKVTPLPKEETCSNWKIKLTDKLNVHWSKVTINDLIPTLDTGVEKSLIDAVSNEINNEINKGCFNIGFSDYLK